MLHVREIGDIDSVRFRADAVGEDIVIRRLVQSEKEELESLGSVGEHGKLVECLQGLPTEEDLHLAGLKPLELISQDGFFNQLGAKTAKLVADLKAAADEAGIPFFARSVGGMFGLFFTDKTRIDRFADVMDCDAERFKAFFHGMLDAGVNLAPSAFEAGFVSAAHTEADLDATTAAAKQVFARL